MRLCDPLLPVFADEFGATLAQAAVTATGFALAYGGFQFFFGPLGDRFGKLRVIAIAGTVASASSAACALASSLDALVLARIAGGAFAGAAIPLALAWIGDNVDFAERQPVLARYLIGQMLGISTGHVAGGVFADLAGWRFAFWLIAALFLLGAASIWPAARREAARAGAAAAAVPAPGLVRGFVRQSRLLLADPWAGRVLLTATLEGLLLFGAMPLVGSYLQRTHGVSPGIAGLVGGLFGLGGIAYAFNTRRLLGRIGITGLARAGGLLFLLAMLVLALPLAWGWAIGATLMAGLGYYMLHNTLQNQASQMSVQARGAAFAWFATGLWVGQGVGVALAAWLAERIGFVPVFVGAGIGIFALAVDFGRALGRRYPVPPPAAAD